MPMPRNARSPNDLHQPPADRAADEAALPAFGFTPLGPDPALGWSGLGAGALEPWAHAQAELLRGDEEGGEADRARREPRDRTTERQEG
jgi:hypothetical protein